MSIRLSFRVLLPALFALVVNGLPAAALPSVNEVASIGAEPSQVLWLGNQALVAQKGRDEILLWDQQQMHTLAHLDGCGPSRMVMTRDNHYLLACSTSSRLLVMNNRGQIVETFPRPPEEAGLVSRSGDNSPAFDLSNVTAMVQDSRGGTYLAVAGSPRPDVAVRGRGRLYYLSPSRSSLTPLGGKLDFPAGMALSADGKWLFVSEALSRQIYRYDVQPGQLLNARVIARTSELYQASAAATEEPWPGALGINSVGQLYIALPGDGRLLVTSAEGKLLASLAVPAPYITGFSFTRSDRILFITATRSAEAGAAGSLYEMRL